MDKVIRPRSNVVPGRHGGGTLIEWAAALSLASLAYVFALSSGAFYALIAALAIGLLVPLGIIVFSQRLKLFSNTYNTLTTFLLGAYLIFNILIHQGNYFQDPSLPSVITHIFGFIAYLFVLNWIASSLDVRRVLSKLALILIPLAIIALANSAIVIFTARSDPFGIQPNWWGELMVAFSVSALALNSLFLRTVIYILAALVLFFVQSRSGMIGWAIVIGIEAARAWKQANAGGRMGLVLLVVLAGFIAFGFTSLGAFVSDKVLLLNNEYRGLGTGFTGRIEGWEEALDAFGRNPIFGQGLGLYSYVHNGFLQVISEGGVVLGAIILAFWINGVRWAWLRVDYLKFGGLLAVAGYMVFQPRILNLNLATLIFWLAMRDWRIDKIATGAHGVRPSRNMPAGGIILSHE